MGANLFRRRWRGIMGLIIGLAVFYAILCALLFAFQRQLIYHPQPSEGDTADSRQSLLVDGIRLQLSVRPRDGPDALVYFGGNAEDVSQSLPDLSLAFPGHALYLLHYRGFGGSEGSPSEEALHADALALFDQVASHHPHVTVLGRSLGSGIAVRLASQRPITRLILVTPFNSLAELARQRFALFPVDWLLQDRYESWRYAPRVRAPTRIIAAGDDEVVPRASTERLYAHFAAAVATLTLIPGTGHNTVSDSPDYLRALAAP